jgi:tRNA A37 threonylcarbamoyladenosine dehydratase
MNPDFTSRTKLLLGEDGLAKLASARIAVFGVGGVGSYAVEALARAGVGRLYLVDNDTVAPSNINRQLHATANTIGQYKTKLMAERIAAINPDAVVETAEAFLLPDNVEELLPGEFDYILDAVDTVAAKLALAEIAYRRGIPIIAAMGAGNKLDPTRFEVADINETSVCPLCRVMRRELKKRGIPRLKVVYSKEPPHIPSPEDIPPEEGRVPPGSISFVPSVAGLIMAGAVVKGIVGAWTGGII